MSRARAAARVILPALVLVAHAWPPEASAQPSPPRRYALVIATDRYSMPDLRSTRSSEDAARSIARALETNGYNDVFLLLGEMARRENVIRELARFARLVAPQDELLVFLSGQTAMSGGRHDRVYWLTYDSRIDLLDLYAIRISHLLEYLQDIPARRKLLLFDSVFAGRVVEATTSPTARSASSERVGIAREALPAGALEEAVRAGAEGLVILAGSEQEAAEPEMRAGPFVLAVLRAIGSSEADQNRDGQVAVSELASYVQDFVARATQGRSKVTVVVRGGTDWNVALAPRSEVEEVATQVDKLRAWQNRGWISFETYLQSRSLLEEWKLSLAGGQPLAPESAATLKLVRAHLASDAAEETKAHALEVTMSALRK